MGKMNRRTIYTPQRYVPNGKATDAWKKFLCEGTDPPGLIVKEIDTDIGKGVFAGKKFHIGSFLMEYRGELIPEKEGIKREQSYPVEFGSFLLYFKSGRSIMCIDATFSTQCGRYVNDGTGELKNAEPKVVYVGTTPHVALFACRNISKGEEIRFDYGVVDLPWRRKQNSPCSLKENSLNYPIKECTVLLRKLDTGANTYAYEKEDGTVADVKINRTTPTELEYHISHTYETLSHTTKEQNKRDHSGIKPLSDEGKSSKIIPSVAQEPDNNIVDVWREGHYIVDDEIVFNFRNVSSKKGQKERDGNEIAPPADKSQSSQMKESVTQEQDDNIADRTREKPDYADREIGHNFPNVSSEKTLSCTTKELHKRDESSLKPLSDEGQSPQIVFSEDQEPDDNTTDGWRETYDIEDVSSEKTLSCTIKELHKRDESSLKPLSDEGQSPQIVFSEDQESYDNTTDGWRETYDIEDVSSENTLSCTTKELHKRDESSLKPLSDEGQSPQIAFSEDQESYDNTTDGWRETYDSEDVSSEKTLSCTTKELHKRDESSLKPLSDEGQSPQIAFSEDQESYDNTTDGWRETYDIEDVSSEKTLSCTTKELHKRDESSLKPLSDEGQSPRMVFSKAQEPDDNTTDGWRETHDIEDVSSEKAATRLNEANSNDIDDLVHCVIIEDQDAASTTVIEGSIELTVSNIGGEQYTIQQTCVEVNPIDHEELIDSTAHCSKEKTASPASSNSQWKKKPHRPCPYCLCFKSALRKHLIKKHGDKTEVAEALKLPKQDRDRAFLLLKRKGIMMTNMIQLRSEDKTSQGLIRERRHTLPNHDVIYCSKCFGFFKKSYFYRHRRNCHLNEQSMYFPHAIQPETAALKDTNEDKFTKEILSSLCNDDVGQICKTENIIVSYGQKKFRKLLTKKNMEKYEDKKINIRNEMRRLGHLFKEFREICNEKKVTCLSFLEMFNPRRFCILEDAIDQVTIKEDGSVKYGLRKDIGYLLKRVCSFLHGKFSVEQNTKNVEQVDSFLNVLTFFWYDIFGEAESSAVFARQTKLRKPSRLPKQTDVKMLRDLMRSSIQNLTESDYTFIASSDFIKLRNLVVSRLTLFNARRGGEACCLLISQWTEAENGDWLGESNEDQDPTKQALLGKYKIAYQTGKNEKLVSLLIIDDCWKAVEKLCDPEVRRQAGVHPENTYVFPRINYSLKHVSGWEAVRKCCDLAGLEHAINATDMRHYVATIYAGLEVNETERETFYNHMGHSESVNKNIYQSPPARQTITRVGRFLHDIDQDTLDNTSDEKERRDGSCNKSLAEESQSSQTIYTRVQEQDDDSGARRNATSDARKQYRTWNRQDTETVIRYFSSCILSTENVETNKGSLPSTEELKRFLKEFPYILREFSKQEKIKRLRSKIFNERKLTREKMRKTVRPGKKTTF